MRRQCVYQASLRNAHASSYTGKIGTGDEAKPTWPISGPYVELMCDGIIMIIILMGVFKIQPSLIKKYLSNAKKSHKLLVIIT